MQGVGSSTSGVGRPPIALVPGVRVPPPFVAALPVTPPYAMTSGSDVVTVGAGAPPLPVTTSGSMNGAGPRWVDRIARLPLIYAALLNGNLSYWTGFGLRYVAETSLRGLHHVFPSVFNGGEPDLEFVDHAMTTWGIANCIAVGGTLLFVGCVEPFLSRDPAENKARELRDEAQGYWSVFFRRGIMGVTGLVGKRSAKEQPGFMWVKKLLMGRHIRRGVRWVTQHLATAGMAMREKLRVRRVGVAGETPAVPDLDHSFATTTKALQVANAATIVGPAVDGLFYFIGRITAPSAGRFLGFTADVLGNGGLEIAQAKIFTPEATVGELLIPQAVISPMVSYANVGITQHFGSGSTGQFYRRIIMGILRSMVYRGLCGSKVVANWFNYGVAQLGFGLAANWYAMRVTQGSDPDAKARLLAEDRERFTERAAWWRRLLRLS